MRRPPDRKLMLAALVMLVAAGVMFSRPAVGVADNGESVMLVFKKVTSRGGL